MTKPASRLTDMHTCPLATPGLPPIPHVGGPIMPPCYPPVLIGMLPAARVGDMCLCVGPPDAIAMGSLTVFIGNQPSARIGDPTIHGGVIIQGWPTVLIGDLGPIQIEGSPAFKAQVIAALAKILATPSGREWMAQMQKNGNTVTIKQGAAGQNDCSPTDPAKAAPGGGGSNSTINWDPNTTSLGGFDPSVGNCGNDTILFHEMVHALHNANGDHRNGPTESFPGQTGGSQRGEERSTVGAPANVQQPGGTTRPVQQAGPPPGDAPAAQQTDYNGTKPGENYPTENSYRRDQGLPERPSYYPTNWPGGPPW